MSEQSIVIGVFEDPAKAQLAIQELKQAGFSNDQVGFVMRNHSGAEVGASTGDAENTTEGTADSIIRSIVSGVIGAVDVLLLPVIGPSPAENALETAIPAAEQTIDRIEGATDSHQEAKEGIINRAEYYKHEFEAGRTIVTIKADGREQQASDLLQHNGAHDVEVHRSS
jgi:hypothetical protein